MAKTFKLVIEYDGTAYHGWQRQKSDRSIQAEIEKALTVMTRQSISLAASGRTDAGVHALGQAAHFTCETAIDPADFRHDFKAFEGTGSPRTSTVRTILRADLKEETDGYLIFEIEGDGFLRYMVRNIVGTLVEVGREKITPQGFRVILESKDREQAGATAPPQGLFLVAVDYES